MTKRMTPDEENVFYANPANQTPTGPAVRRRDRLGDPVPVRFPSELIDKVRDAAAMEDRSVSSWIRRAVEHELEREPS